LWGADQCLTKPEAQRKFGARAHLYWHTTAHCWDNERLTDRVRYHFQRDAADIDEPPKLKAEVVGPSIAFPTVVRVDEMPEPGLRLPIAWFNPWPMSTWPLVYDFDTPARFSPWRRRIE
jgi:hypothetical protein